MKQPLLAMVFAFAPPAARSAFVSGGDFVLAERGVPPSCALEVVSKEPSAAHAAQELSDFLVGAGGIRLEGEPRASRRLGRVGRPDVIHP